MIAAAFPSLVGSRPDDGESTVEEARNLEVIRRLRAAEFDERRRYSQPGVRPHRSGLSLLSRRAIDRGGIGYDSESIADREDEILDMIAKGDRVWAMWRVRGTHTGELCGFPPTTRPLEFLELGIWRLVDGKVAESWFFGDELGLLEQLQLASGQ